MMATEVKPNTLVQYQGGGYDGCFWEWNFAYFDKDGKFHCIVATGYKGCKTEDDLQKVLGDSHTYLYDLTTEEGIKEFGTESAVDHVIGVAKWFAEQKIDDITFLTVCEECKETVTVLDCKAEGMKSCGGIVYQHDKIICSDCHETGSCPYCGDFVGEDRIHPESGLCCDKHADGSWCDDEDDGWCHVHHRDEWE